MEILEKVVLFGVMPSFLSGERALPGVSKKIGAKRKKETIEVIDRKLLAPLNGISTELYRLCRSYGTKVKLPPIEAWAVEDGLAPQLETEIKRIEARFNSLVEDLVRDFKELNLDWAQRNPDEYDEIIKLGYTEAELEKGFSFSYASIKLTREQVISQSGYDAALEGLAGKAIREFSDQLRDQGVKDPGKHVFTGAITGVLAQIQRKARSLAFLDPRIQEVASVLDGVLKSMPTRGRLDDGQRFVLRVVVDRLMNPAELVEKGFPKLDSEFDEVEDEIKPVQQQAAQVTTSVKKHSSQKSIDSDPLWPIDDMDDDISADINGIVGSDKFPEESIAW
jgi:hypothetical protein